MCRFRSTNKAIYIGFLKNNNYGFYISEYDVNGITHYLAATQMQGPHARKAFPCFDEPAFKVKGQRNIINSFKIF